MPRVLIAGVGNVLRGDDGFGPAVVQALEAAGPLPAGVRTVEVGIGGLGLVHELMEGCDALVVVDAVDRGGAPGTLYVLEPEVPEIETIPEEQRPLVARDLHEIVPGRVLLMARALGILPPLVRMIGCQPGNTEEFALELTPAVRPAVPAALRAIDEFLDALLRPTAPATPHG